MQNTNENVNTCCLAKDHSSANTGDTKKRCIRRRMIDNHTKRGAEMNMTTSPITAMTHTRLFSAKRNVYM